VPACRSGKGKLKGRECRARFRGLLGGGGEKEREKFHHPREGFWGLTIMCVPPGAGGERGEIFRERGKEGRLYEGQGGIQVEEEDHIPRQKEGGKMGGG